MNSSVVSILAAALVISVVYAVFGNVAVYAILARRGISLQFMRVGMPGYLYRHCVAAGPSVGAPLRRFALSTNIAFILALIFGVGIGGLQH